LVINENSYGLLLSFGFSCRTCPQPIPETYVGFKVEIRRKLKDQVFTKALFKE
jgi:hypothetical protein